MFSKSKLNYSNVKNRFAVAYSRGGVSCMVGCMGIIRWSRQFSDECLQNDHIVPTTNKKKKKRLY